MSFLKYFRRDCDSSRSVNNNHRKTDFEAVKLSIHDSLKRMWKESYSDSCFGYLWADIKWRDEREREKKSDCGGVTKKQREILSVIATDLNSFHSFSLLLCDSILLSPFFLFSLSHSLSLIFRNHFSRSIQIKSDLFQVVYFTDITCRSTISAITHNQPNNRSE